MILKLQIEQIVKTNVDLRIEFPFYLTEQSTETCLDKEIKGIAFLKYENVNSLEIHAVNTLVRQHEFHELKANYWENLPNEYKIRLLNASENQELEKLKFEFIEFISKIELNPLATIASEKSNRLLDFIKRRFHTTK